jgi:hypothetical protein
MPAAATIDDLVSDDILPPVRDRQIFEWNSLDSDSRLKLYFIGSLSKQFEQPELHFLVTPLSYAPGSTPGTHEIMYFSISQYHIYAFNSNNAQIEPVQTHKGSYFLFHDVNDDKLVEKVIPFIFSKNPEYKLCPRSLYDTVRGMQQEIWELSRYKKPEEEDPERDEAMARLDESIESTYSLLISTFIRSLGSNKPARWSSLHPKDWMKKKFPLDAPARMLDYVADIIGWIVQR